MAEFFAELKRRHIYRVGATYVVAGWALTQVVEILAQVYTLPLWIAQTAIAFLALGFPIALLAAWTIESKPHHAVAAAVRSKPTIVDWTLCGALGVVLIFMGYQQIAPSGAPTWQAGVGAVKDAAASPASAISIAVLPFTNLSSDPEQEFFSDGMTEEITAALAKVPDLRVVGRTSAFQFKGENRDLRAIGQALSATHLIEGSVRKDGSQLRITAQLIATDAGTHLWTESYDRELQGVFALQEEIATSIASALRVPLGLRQGETLISNRTADTDSYQDYLRARALVRGRGTREPGGVLTQAASLLEQVVVRDPNYAPGWGLLGQAYVLTPAFSTAVANGAVDQLRPLTAELLQKAENAAREAIRLDASNVDGHTALALARNYRGAFAEAEDFYKRALTFDSGNPDALHQYSFMLANIGRLKDSLALRLRLQAQEPLVPVFNQTTGRVLWENGQNEEAISVLESLPAKSITRIFLVHVYASLGRNREAAGVLREFPPGLFAPGVVEEATRLLLTEPPRTISPQSTVSNGLLGVVYLYAGAPERSLDFYQNLAEAGYSGNFADLIWAPAYAMVRKTELFRNYARKAGFVDYWRARGWPDLCRPIGTDDFECS